MSEPVTTKQETQVEASADSFRPQRSFIGRFLLDTFGRWGARLGLVWIAVVGFLAVYAPLIANSHPILMRKNGEWSSPLLAHLTGVDVILLVAGTGLLVLLAMWRVAIRWKVAGTLWLAAWTTPFAMLGTVRVQWESWREGLAEQLPPPVDAIALGMLIVLGVVVAWGIAGLITARSTAPGWLKASVGTVGLIVAVVLLISPVVPKRNVIYSQYREGLASGEIDVSIETLVPYSPSDRMIDLPDTRLANPSWDHPMGCDSLGQDVFSRMTHACRIAMAIGFIATGIAVVIGVTIGGLMGYFSGIVDLLGMRLVEVFSAIPVIFLLIAFVAFYGRNIYLIMVIIGVTGWMGYARFTRAEYLRLRQQDFVSAARACGLPLWSILFRHMLPNGVTPVLVSASFGVASAILYESTLSFLGLGLVEEPSWGQLLNEARGVGGGFYWWLATYPGMAIFLTVFAYNLIGEAMRDAIDPYTSRLT